MTKRNKWKKEEIQFLIDNYELSGGTIIAKVLVNHSYSSITRKSQRIGLKVDKSIHTFNLDKIKNLVKESYCYADVFRKLEKSISGESYKILKNYIRKNNIDTSHFEPYKNNKIVNKKYDLTYWLENGSNINSSKLKEKLYRENLKERKCELCGQDEIWNGKRMSLILDHINGVNNDNRLENLRIVCPNCNATLETHCRGYKYLSNKNLEKIIKSSKKIKKERNDNGFTNEEVKSYIKQRKVERPPYEELKTEIKLLGLEGTGRKYNVCGNSIKKWLKTYENIGL